MAQLLSTTVGLSYGTADIIGSTIVKTTTPANSMIANGTAIRPILSTDFLDFSVDISRTDADIDIDALAATAADGTTFNIAMANCINLNYPNFRVGTSNSDSLYLTTSLGKEIRIASDTKFTSDRLFMKASGRWAHPSGGIENDDEGPQGLLTKKHYTTPRSPYTFDSTLNTLTACSIKYCSEYRVPGNATAQAEAYKTIDSTDVLPNPYISGGGPVYIRYFMITPTSSSGGRMTTTPGHPAARVTRAGPKWSNAGYETTTFHNIAFLEILYYPKCVNSSYPRYITSIVAKATLTYFYDNQWRKKTISNWSYGDLPTPSTNSNTPISTSNYIASYLASEFNLSNSGSGNNGSFLPNDYNSFANEAKLIKTCSSPSTKRSGTSIANYRYNHAYRIAFFTHIYFDNCEIQEFANNYIDSNATGIKGGAYYWPEDF